MERGRLRRTSPSTWSPQSPVSQRRPGRRHSPDPPTRPAPGAPAWGAGALVGGAATPVALYVGLDRNCLGGLLRRRRPAAEGVLALRQRSRRSGPCPGSGSATTTPFSPWSRRWFGAPSPGLWLILKGPSRARWLHLILAGICLPWRARSPAGTPSAMAGYANWFAVPPDRRRRRRDRRSLIRQGRHADHRRITACAGHAPFSRAARPSARGQGDQES